MVPSSTGMNLDMNLRQNLLSMPKLKLSEESSLESIKDFRADLASAEDRRTIQVKDLT